MSNLKDSGVYWLGEVASDWDLVPAWRVMRERSEKSRPDDVHLTPSQTYGVITQEDYMSITGNKVVLNLTGSANMKRVHAGDFVIHLRSFQGGIEASAIGGKVSNAYTVLSPSSDAHFDYYRWFMKSAPLIEGLASSTDQLRDGQSINFGRFSRFTLPLPPLDTQQRIADYLDRETAEIDAAVADLDKYVELLEKRRRAIAVSAIFPHGFPKNLLSAQSYLDLGYNSVIRIGAFAKLRKTRNSDQDAQYLSLMKGIGVILYEEKGNVGNKKPQDLSDAFAVEAGDYLVNSMNFKIGSFGRSRYAGVASGAYLIFSVDDNVVNPDFLQYVFENDDLRSQAQNLGNGILEHRKSINWDRFRSIYLPHPSREEQDAVVESLRKQTAEIDALVEESTKLRNLLLKRRSVLITEVVTGRKQV